MNRTIITYGNYFFDFYSSLDKGAQEKIDYVFEFVKSQQYIPKRFFKNMENTDGLFEIRVEYESNSYRIFCFFDEGQLVVLINSFHKKSQKTPRKDLDLATSLKKHYFIDKKNDLENG